MMARIRCHRMRMHCLQLVIDCFVQVTCQVGLVDLPSSLAERAALPSSVPEEVVHHLPSSLAERVAPRPSSVPEVVVRHLSSWLASSQLRRLPETEVHRLRSSLAETVAHRLLRSHQLPLNWSLLHVNNRHANIS